MSAKKYKCSVCGYVFNAANAAKYYSLDGSLQFEDVPIDWKCPICGYSKEFFVEIEYSELQTKEKSKKNVAENISDFPHTRTQIYTQNEFISDKNAEKLNYDDSDKNQENKNFLLKEQAFRHLKDIILPYWSNLADYQCGGFYGYVDYNLQINKNAQKGVILHSRILWFYSTAYNVIGGEKNKKLATHAYDFLTEYCFDKKNGGLYWLMNSDCSCADSTKNTYNQAFGIYALSAYSRSTDSKEALRYAYELFECIEAYCTDEYGYLEAFDSEWKKPVESAICDQGITAEKTMNTLLHVLEAYTELLDVDSHPRVAQKLKNILQLCNDKLYYDDFERLEVFFDEKMNPVGDIHSYGHDIEASWLLDKACDVLDKNSNLFDLAEQKELKILISDTYAYTSIIAKKILENAFMDNSVYNEARGERNGNAKIDKTRIWWVQAEAVVGFYNEFQKNGASPFKDAAKRVFDYIEKYVVDKRNGSEWFGYLNEDGTPIYGRPITEPWKCPYHNGRMCLELIIRNAE